MIENRVLIFSICQISSVLHLFLPLITSRLLPSLTEKVDPILGAGHRMENLGVPRNHISLLMGHEDGNMALDVYTGGLAIEPLRESMNKLSFGE